MKTPLLLLALAAIPLATPALAHDRAGCGSLTCATCGDIPLRWGPRVPGTAARFAITTRNGAVTLALTDAAVALQLSDHTFRRVRRELRAEADEREDGPLGNAIRSAVVAGVSALLDHSARCPLDHLRDAEYTDGRLVFTTRDGRTLFADADTDGRDVMGDFDERDARAFVREFHRAAAVAR